jgi:MFS family permease
MNSAVDSAADASLFSPEWRNISIGMIGLCSMMAFEAIGVAAGMPVVAKSLDGMSLYALAFASTMAGSVVAMVWSGLDCDRNGPFRSMAGGLLFFAIGLLVAGLAGSMYMLIFGRIIQGLGIGALCVALYVATARALPTALLPRLFAMFSSAWVVPAVIGPAISGYIVEVFGWRWLFLGIFVLLLPAAALILPPLYRVNEASKKSKSKKSDSVLIWALLAALSCVGLSMSGIVGNWASLIVIITLAILLTSAQRLLPAGTLRLAPGLPTVIALRGLNASAFFLCEAFVPLWLHLERAWSISTAGLALTSGALSWSIGSHLQSRITVEAKRRAWLGYGGVLLCVGIVISGLTVMQFWPDWMLLIGWSISGLGVGLSLPMLGVLTLKLAPKEQQGTYSSALQLSAAICTSAALAVGGVLFSLLQGQSSLLAYVSVFVFATLLASLALISLPLAFFGSGEQSDRMNKTTVREEA